MCANQQDGIVELFAEAKVKFHLSGRNSYYSYSRYYNTDISGVSSKANLFIKKGCLRINSIEFNKGKAYFTMPRGRLVGSYQSNSGYANLLTAITNISLVIPGTSSSRDALGSYILNTNGGFSVPLTRNVYPVVTDLDDNARMDSNNIFIELSNNDNTFINATNTVDMSLLYTKHKALCVQEEKEVRNCKAIYNASKTLKIVVREEKKKLSDDEAYKNRIFRDYLSHAISMVAIPVFQKDFVIPECLQKSFVFKMASLQSAWYSILHRKQTRLAPSYGISFNAENRPPEWKMPDIPTYIPVKANIVSAFVKEFRNKTITSTTQSRSSLFTRYFVEPFIEKSANSYSYPKDTCLFGWMLNTDNQSQSGWLYKDEDSHLLRNTPAHGNFFRDCGLVSDKTFGIQSIMANIFTTDDFNNGSNHEYSIMNPGQHVPTDKKGQYISAVLDIYSANFVPVDDVEKAIQSYGAISFSQELARVNQLLFLQDEGLNILKGLYSCETFEDLSTCLDLCMPICLDILETLDYSTELKAHVRNMLSYFWNTTTAIAKELQTHDAVKK